MPNYIKIKEIKLLSPNAKLNKLILENYPSIDAFAEEMNIYPSTLKQYLRSSKLGSDKFKIQIVTKLKVDIASLYLSYKEQLSAYVYDINNHIRHYSTSDDLALLKELSEQTLKNNMYTEHFVTLFNIGRYEYFNSNYERAHTYMDCALAYFFAESYSALRLEVLLSKSKVYAKQYHFKIEAQVNKVNALNALKEAKLVFCSLDKYENNLKYRFYQITGYAYSLLDEPQLALDAFRMALLNTEDPTNMAKSMCYISQCESLLGNLEESMAYYSEIMKNVTENKPLTSWIHLNISTIYLKLGDYSMMEIYLSMVDRTAIYELTSGFYYYYHTWLSSLIELGLTVKALQFFDQLMLDFSSKEIKLQDKVQVMNMLRHMINDIDSDNDREVLHHLERAIATYIQSNEFTDQILLNHLIHFLGNIRLKTLFIS